MLSTCPSTYPDLITLFSPGCTAAVQFSTSLVAGSVSSLGGLGLNIFIYIYPKPESTKPMSPQALQKPRPKNVPINFHEDKKQGTLAQLSHWVGVYGFMGGLPFGCVHLIYVYIRICISIYK